MSFGRTVAIISVTGSFAILFVTTEGTVGRSYHSVNGNVTVAGGTNPGALVATVILIACYVFLLLHPPRSVPVGPGGLFRRYLAFIVDFFSGGLPLAAISGGVYSLIEARRVGRWAWQFSRDYAVPSDPYVTVVGFLAVSLGLVYFALPLTLGRQTIGCIALGLAVTGDAGQLSWPAAVARVLLGFVSLAGLIIFIWPALFDPERRMFHDKVTHTRVLAVSYGS